MDLYILSDLLRGDVGLHGKAMSSSSRYCGCPNVYSFQQYMDITIAAIFSNIWYFQCFKYLSEMSMNDFFSGWNLEWTDP